MCNVLASQGKDEDIAETERIVKEAEDQINQLLEIEEFATIEEDDGNDDDEEASMEKEVESLIRTTSVADINERQRGDSTSLSFLSSPTDRESSKKVDLDAHSSSRNLNKSPTRTKTVKRASMTSEGNWEVCLGDVYVAVLNNNLLCHIDGRGGSRSAAG